ncbi:MAG: PAS domain S-box protein [Campylobacterota bacterium]|nr:PAS domain S-box protein [Campylobacterota bacterium]
MSEKRYRSIKIKLVFLLSFSATIALFLSSAAIFTYTFNEKKEEGINSLSQVSRIMGENLIAAIEFDDSDSATTMLHTLELAKNIEAAFIFKDKVTIFASYIKDIDRESEVKKIIIDAYENKDIKKDIKSIESYNLIVSRPIYFEKEYLGTFAIVANTDHVDQTIYEQFILLIVVSIVSLLVVIFFALRMQRMFTLPILRLKDAMEKIVLNKDYSVHVYARSNDEFKILFDGFNTMIDTIEEQNSKLENYTETLNETIELKTKDIIKQNSELEVLVSAIDKNVIFSKTDLSGKITHVSEAFCAISGYNEAELVGKQHNIVRHPDMPKDIFKGVWSAIQNGMCWFGEVKNLRKDGSFYWVYTKIEPDFNSENEQIGYYAIRQDITSKKEVEELSENLELKVAERTAEVELKKQEIESIHKHTRESIEYASLIQGALIPDNKIFRNYFQDYFAIWHPKDTVGGDIYLFEDLRNDDECLLLVIDCTGHGVPGAFVTMLVKAIERQIVAKIKQSDEDVSPANLLGVFNRSMKNLLKQEHEDSISNAGFDGGILYYNKKDKIVKFAGAETPLFYTQDGELKVLKGNRKSVGYKKCEMDYEYKEHIIDVEEGMKFYLTTDGYLDQNGGEKGFCFGKKRFQNIIKEYGDESMADQQEVFLYELDSYEADYERNDDVTLIAFEI